MQAGGRRFDPDRLHQVWVVRGFGFYRGEVWVSGLRRRLPGGDGVLGFVGAPFEGVRSLEV